MTNRNKLIEIYFHLGLEYKDIVNILIAKHKILLSERTLKRTLQRQGLFRRKNYTNLQEVVAFIRRELQGSGSCHGYRWMFEKCKLNGLNVRKEHVRVILSLVDPIGTEMRRARRLSRRSYFSKGPNYIWHMDSYDKLRPFGLCINGCIDGFARKLCWLNAYRTSSDPRVIGGYFVETVKSLQGCPRIVRADRGTENCYVREFQRFLRRNGSDAFAEERSFMYGSSNHNQRIESFWGFLRKECIEFWLEFFHGMKNEGYFDGTFLDVNLVLFCFLGLIQVHVLYCLCCSFFSCFPYFYDNLSISNVSRSHDDKLGVL